MSPISQLAAAINAQLQSWQQGDVLLDVEIAFVFLADYTQPITPESQAAAQADQTTDGDPLGTVSVNFPGLYQAAEWLTL